mgnify:FL=1
MNKQDTLNIIWTSQEIIDHAKDGMGIDLSIEDARKTLRLLERKHDSEVGINWHSITCAIEEIISIKYKQWKIQYAKQVNEPCIK